MGTALVALAAWAPAGCGESSQYDAAYFEQEIPAAYEEQDGSTFTDPSCVRESDTRFKCVGDYTPSREAVEESMDGVDTSSFGEADWDALTKQQSGRIALTVTVDPDTGKWVSER